MVYIRKDVADNSETIEKEGQTVTNNDYHKVYDALKGMSTVKSVTFSSKEEQYEKLTETMGDNWKIFEGEQHFHQFWYLLSIKWFTNLLISHWLVRTFQ